MNNLLTYKIFESKRELKKDANLVKYYLLDLEEENNIKIEYLFSMDYDFDKDKYFIEVRITPSRWDDVLDNNLLEDIELKIKLILTEIDYKLENIILIQGRNSRKNLRNKFNTFEDIYQFLSKNNIHRTDISLMIDLVKIVNSEI